MSHVCSFLCMSCDVFGWDWFGHLKNQPPLPAFEYWLHQSSMDVLGSLMHFLSYCSPCVSLRNCSSNMLLSCFQWFPNSGSNPASAPSQVRQKPFHWAAPRQGWMLDSGSTLFFLSQGRTPVCGISSWLLHTVPCMWISMSSWQMFCPLHWNPFSVLQLLGCCSFSTNL